MRNTKEENIDMDENKVNSAEPMDGKTLPTEINTWT